ncbi:hypothetical protein TIFTF001_049398 [Ficus carica]|uniref:Uncharacterized protein n=1 Tax=Ficus carica TaxID=3494 RepID=A0AA87Z374_FICCA|nr:hypothetical protein TIFTF001_049398 [Ficus carica]
MKVYHRADAEMVGLAGDRPVYSADYYTSAVTLRYLAAHRREFNIPDDVDLVVPGANDLPSRPPSGHIALSVEYFRAGPRLPFHPFLRRTLTSLNVAPTQLNTNTYRVLISCYILISKGHSSRGVRTRISRSSTCVYAGGRWRHEHLSYFELPPSERIPVAFRRGYVWTRAPHVSARTLARIDELRELSDPERSQHRPPRRRDHGRPIGSSTGGARGHEPMADRERHGTKCPSAEERIARLHKMAGMGKGKGKEGASTVPPSEGSVPSAPPAKTTVPPATHTSRPEARPDRPREDRPRDDRPRGGRPTGRHEARSGRSREDRPEVPPPAPRSGRDEPRPRDAAPLPSILREHIDPNSSRTAMERVVGPTALKIVHWVHIVPLVEMVVLALDADGDSA